MAFKRVDDDDPQEFVGFSYINNSGAEEGVLVSPHSAELVYTEDGSELCAVFYEDIPNLIKALQAAYDYYMKGSA